MLRNAVEIRSVGTHEDERFELYDSDTGTSLGLYESFDRADAERRSLQDSDHAAYRGGSDADPGPE
ncbi:MAG: hypothetical protein UMU75_00315 [Halomonas sp.]|nr:hypothetical protein [Halomonas sp.]